MGNINGKHDDTLDALRYLTELNNSKTFNKFAVDYNPPLHICDMYSKLMDVITSADVRKIRVNFEELIYLLIKFRFASKLRPREDIIKAEDIRATLESYRDCCDCAWVLATKDEDLDKYYRNAAFRFNIMKDLENFYMITDIPEDRATYTKIYLQELSIDNLLNPKFIYNHMISFL